MITRKVLEEMADTFAENFEVLLPIAAPPLTWSDVNDYVKIAAKKSYIETFLAAVPIIFEAQREMDTLEPGERNLKYQSAESILEALKS